MPLLGIFWMGSGHVYFGSFWFIGLDEIKSLKILKSFLDSRMASMLTFSWFVFLLCALSLNIYFSFYLVQLLVYSPM